tara:strand:+ start:331 stop:891 length:561 start_codon:yes stop_codon:yes gene_type:complete
MNKEELLSIIKNKVGKISTKQKIWIAAAFLLWLAQCLLWFTYPSDEGFLYNIFFFDPKTSEIFVIVLALSGLIYSIYRKIKSRQANKDKSLVYIITNDYNFSSYASLRILSIVYAVLQGILLGASLAFIIQVFGSILSFSRDIILQNLLYTLVCLLYLLITRVVIEGVSLIFRVAEDLSKSISGGK